jgi:hypothetical protein
MAAKGPFQSVGPSLRQAKSGWGLSEARQGTASLLYFFIQAHTTRQAHFPLSTGPCQVDPAPLKSILWSLYVAELHFVSPTFFFLLPPPFVILQTLSSSSSNSKTEDNQRKLFPGIETTLQQGVISYGVIYSVQLNVSSDYTHAYRGYYLPF